MSTSKKGTSYGFADYQRDVKETAVYPYGELFTQADEGYFVEVDYPIDLPVLYTALGLASEAGEYAGKIKKLLRGDERPDDLLAQLTSELGDVLWYVTRAAAELGYDLQEIAAMNARKLQDRQQRGVLKGSGDER